MKTVLTLLSPSIRDRLVGVIDVKQGQAVHAVAGQRHLYRPVAATTGDAIQLARRYHEIGLRRIYLADLDAIQHSEPPSPVVERLLGHRFSFDEVIIDAGWSTFANHDALTQFDSVSEAAIRWVISTESADSLYAIRKACDVVSADRLVLGLDYRNGQLTQHGDAKEADWIKESAATGIGRVIALDLADVGTGSGGSTGKLCRRIRQSWPDVNIYAGGGIRDARDVERLVENGCDFCLIATALHDVVRT